MKHFVQSKYDVHAVNMQKVDKFIDQFNEAINKPPDEDYENRGVYSLNTGLDGVSDLSDSEFQLVVQRAAADGYTLTKFEDNYNTTTYQITKKK